MDTKDFTPKWMSLLILSPFFFSFIYYIAGKNLLDSQMTLFQYLQLTALIAVVVPGGYQLYFWTQRHSNFFKTRVLKIWIDDYIPFWPKWVWVYSFFYYILIGGFLIMIPNIETAVYVIFGGLVLLVSQCIFFILFPAINPPEWRQFEPDTISKKFLKFVQAFDDENNCFPSMHCSLATYISLTMFPVIAYYSFIPIFLIAISCLLTKQHQFMDVVPGVGLGAFVYWIVF
ncbi:hypothetical protein D9V86_09005 [Bacteroidetes/Chlorobi group bacterium ChocPot_Mid]|jgi:hypothetical protein|nr:MAG: hypothetical protein D9V86_09005 [Bacteroidetes/Chlorobi group bacterium ChocPot_Mid]